MEKEVRIVKMGTTGTTNKFLVENKLWGCGFDYDESTGNYVPCDNRQNRFKPLLAVCKTWRKEDRRYLPYGRGLLYGQFDATNVKYGDVLAAEFADTENRCLVRTEYYVVLSNNKDGLTIADGSWSTYMEAYGYIYTLKYNKRNNKTKIGGN